jgi:hypothetical protein
MGAPRGIQTVLVVIVAGDCLLAPGLAPGALVRAHRLARMAGFRQRARTTRLVAAPSGVTSFTR